jgi:tetratricopeptide (TPR) repeat protein
MKNFGMRIAGGLTVCLLGLVSLAQPGRVMAQAATPAVAPGTASIHGHVIDRAGIVVSKGEVRLSTDRNPNTVNRKFEYTFPLDENGDYKGTEIKPGAYVGMVFQKDPNSDNLISVDQQPAPMVAGEDKALDFDMTRQAYIDKLSPSEREALETFKKEHAEAMSKNAKIENLNKMLVQARADTKAGNFAPAIKAMTDATAAKPDAVVLWVALGDAQLGDAVAADKAAKAIKATDASVPRKLTAAMTSYRKALDLNAALAKPDTKTISVVNNQLGVALGRLALVGDSDKRADYTKDAIAAYEAAAVADPTGAEKAFLNEAVMLYNVNLVGGKADGLVDVANKIIALDPTKPDAYYFKAEGLAPSISVASDGKITAPPGLVDACNKYLELAPVGPYAKDMKDLLAGVTTQAAPVPTYKAPKKK